MYDYYLGGKNHFAADREAADKWIAAVPSGPTGPRENRAFLGRAVRFLAAEAGITQFLDIGTGLPTTGNVHDVAQAVNPACRVVYADNDPLVLAHRVRCSPRRQKAAPRTFTPTCGSRTRSCRTTRSARHSTSASRSRC